MDFPCLSSSWEDALELQILVDTEPTGKSVDALLGKKKRAHLSNAYELDIADTGKKMMRLRENLREVPMLMLLLHCMLPVESGYR